MKKIITRALAIVVMLSLLFTMSVLAVEALLKNECFIIQGNISPVKGGDVFVVAVKNGVALENAADSDFIYMDQKNLEKGEIYQFHFKSPYSASKVDIYVNDGEKKFIPIQDFSGRFYISAEIDVKTLIDALEYGINIKIDELFGDYSSEQFKIMIACYSDTMLKAIITEDVLFDAAINETISLIVPEGTTDAKVFMWKAETLTPIADTTLIQVENGEDITDYNLNTTFSGDPRYERGFSWEASSKFENMVIQYGTDAENLTKEKAARYVKAKTGNMDFKDRNGLEKCFYKVELEDLPPGETYYYRIGDKKNGYFSKIYSFTTAEDNKEDFSILAFTDPQGWYKSNYSYYKKAVNTALADCPEAEFICNLGDMTDYGYQADLWGYYFKAMSGVKESLPAVTVVGNHDTRVNTTDPSYADYIDGSTLYNLYFNNPKNGAGLAENTTYVPTTVHTQAILDNLDNTVYSFDYKDAHFAVLNTGTDWDNPGMVEVMKLQKEWLKNDLNASAAKWKVVLIHRGLYTAKVRDSGPKDVFLDVIDECGVDLVLQGHDHSYMRTYQMKHDVPVDKNLECVQKGNGTVYSVIGASAAKRYTPTATDLEFSKNYAAVSKAVPTSYPSYTIINFKQDKLEFIEKTTDGSVMDRFKILIP